MSKSKFRFFLPLLIMVLIIVMTTLLSSDKKETFAIDNSIDPSTWTYVDGLGRTGSTNVSKNGENRYVGVFYWTWHYELNGPGPYNLNDIIEANPAAKNDYNSPVWQKYDVGTNGYYWWNQPIYGYYRENDDYVLRKHAELLADAGVDFIVFDCTNGPFTWESAYENLLKVWLRASQDGVNVPKIAFMLPFGYTEAGTATQFMNIYNNLYNPNSVNYQLYHDLFFYYNGKPLILMNGYKKANAEVAMLLEKFEVRENYPAYFTTGAQANGSWGWLSTYPQAYYKKANGQIEQTTVGVSMNANYNTNKLAAMNSDYIMGRSYAKGNYSYSYKYRNQTITVGSNITGNTARYDNTSFYGRNFQQQWDYAIAMDPEVVFVTGWNEWLVSRIENWEGTPNAFPDQFNNEYSRDIEPSNSELLDHYYYQLVDNIRRYKGTTTQKSQDTPVTINKLSDWDNGSIISYNHYVGGMHRNIVGFGTTEPITYVNNTFRNDIETAKVSYDNSYIYFYVKTNDTLSSSTDHQWMRLLIDTTDSETSTSTQNWEEYEYIVNRENITATTMTLEKSTGGWNFTKVGNVDYTVSNNILQIKIPRSYLGLTGENISFNFKWCDNNLDYGNIMTVYISGDSAPGGRFAFHFSGKAKYSEPTVEENKVTFDSSLDVNETNKQINFTVANNTVSKVLEKIKVTGTNITVGIYDKNSTKKETNDLVATGDKLIIYINNQKNAEYIISVLGDINGDGQLTITDVSKLFQYYRKKITMDNIYIHSGDIISDNEIKLTDIAKLFQYIRGKISGLR